MNFKDAIESLLHGYQIKRPGFVTITPGADQYSFSKIDMCATDWEVIPKKVTITIEDLEKAWEKTGRECKSPVVAMLAHELGLK